VEEEDFVDEDWPIVSNRTREQWTTTRLGVAAVAVAVTVDDGDVLGHRCRHCGCCCHRHATTRTKERRKPSGD
jgi:hypothetical protein